MSKHKLLLTLAGVLALPMVATASVSAVDASCSITNSGPGSNNTCTTNTDYRCEVENNTVLIFDNNDQQVAQSGSATTGGNTGGGDATSGSATNSNGTTFEFTVTNAGCVVATVTTPTPPTPTTPRPVGGAGGGGGAGAAPAVRPTVLANTAGENPIVAVIASMAALIAATAGVHGLTLLQSRK